MKKLFALALISGLAVASCSKKETTTESDSMLQEPVATSVSDSSAVQDSPTKAYGNGSPEAPDSVAIDPQTDVK
ncbi:hypothetical protein [Kaistella rhinocerotis]|uniref:hypothetical protein n=1 Tax=Kaistella rhinocerotis TaxID=3026437 RepID=UPI0025569A69|nr:hypothetical protein [Kaistella sp. Ran72]